MNDGGGAENAMFQCTPATYDQTVGVEQQGRVRWHGHRAAAQRVRRPPQDAGSSTSQYQMPRVLRRTRASGLHWRVTQPVILLRWRADPYRSGSWREEFFGVGR
jgi:hypothetical protein